MDQKTRSNRALGKQNREQLSEESRFHKSREIAENLMATTVWKQAKQVLCALRIQKAHHGMAGADPVMMILALSGSICTVVLALPVSLLQMELLQHHLVVVMVVQV